MSDPEPFTVRAAIWRWLACGLWLLLVAAIARMAWLCDDAFITFRCVENLVHGQGPVWNVDERVQAYTHPLWFLLLSLLRFLTGECATTTMLLSITIASAAAAWLVRGAGTAGTAAVLLVVLLGSRAWLDYATSGLETPLVALLLAALWAATTTAEPPTRLRRTAVLTGLLALTRIDLLVLCAPLLLAAARGQPWRRSATTVLLGLAPFFAWLVFATVYYGSPFPVTASAKAFHHGVPAGELMRCGLHYFVRCAEHDPLTVLTIAAATVLGLCRRGLRAPSLALLAYNAYVVKVGGDYMFGRFLLPSFVVAVAMLGRLLAGAPRFAAPLVIVAALAATFVPGVPDVLQPLPTAPPSRNIPADGLVSERDYYFLEHGLFSPMRAHYAPGFVTDTLRSQGYQGHAIAVAGAVGVQGFLGGDAVHIVDPWLLDPSLMRLPIADPEVWRIGHYYRSIPEGYLETLATGENRMRDPGFARFHAAMWTVRTAPVWSAPRWQALWQLWRGGFDRDLAAFVAGDYRHPPRIEVPIAQLSAPLPAPATSQLPAPFWWDVHTTICVRNGGIGVTLPAPSTAHAVVLHASHGEEYTVHFRRDGQTTGSASVKTPQVPPDCLFPYRVEVPAGAVPFDSLWIDIPITPRPFAAAIARIELLP